MKDYARIIDERVKMIGVAVVILGIFCAFLGGMGIFNKVVSFLPWIIISIVTTGICQILIQTVAGDSLEKIPLTFKIKGMTISVSLFFVITIVLKLWLF